jgi:hypothetical protein
VTCKPQITPTEDTPSAPSAPKENFDQLKQQALLVVDSAYSNLDDFGQLFECYLVSSNGSAEQVSDSEALAEGQKLLSKEWNQAMPRPVFKVRDTDNVVLLLIRNNQAAMVLIDKNANTVENLQFLPGFKTDQLKDKKVAFQQQLVGLSVDFTEDNFALVPWEGEPDPQKMQVDGITGATPICEASLEMLNNQLPFYRDYFLTNEEGNNL